MHEHTYTWKGSLIHLNPPLANTAIVAPDWCIDPMARVWTGACGKRRGFSPAAAARTLDRTRAREEFWKYSEIFFSKNFRPTFFLVMYFCCLTDWGNARDWCWDTSGTVQSHADHEKEFVGLLTLHNHNAQMFSIDQNLTTRWHPPPLHSLQLPRFPRMKAIMWATELIYMCTYALREYRLPTSERSLLQC